MVVERVPRIVVHDVTDIGPVPHASFSSKETRRWKRQCASKRGITGRAWKTETESDREEPNTHTSDPVPFMTSAGLGRLTRGEDGSRGREGRDREKKKGGERR